ncbi:STAS domain-containing protein [Halobacillus halophilus]|uniref:STAS domain-containing protein n=1 Tax=Halobacillus halophilus TaxID=1570 RepID=UPI001CD542EB|nr:STAS domain-containing protein [Halobacillus halophilus]MCA1010302.1 STAS domain-containing protein [Halobacillus halophilus]
MANLNEKMADYFKEHQTILVNELLPRTLDQLEIDYSERDLNYHFDMLRRLLDRVAKSLLRTDEETTAAEIGYDSENYFYSKGVLLKQTIDVLSVFRLSLLKHMRKTDLVNEGRVEEGFMVSEQIVYAFDAAIRATTENYNKTKEEEHAKMEKHLNAISTPVVLINHHQAVLPLVGEFSQDRFEVVMDQTLHKVKEHSLHILFIDFSGIADFDTIFINDLFNLTRTIELLGTRTVLTGIRTEMAMAAIQAGMNFDQLETYSDLRQALEAINQAD